MIGNFFPLEEKGVEDEADRKEIKVKDQPTLPLPGWLGMEVVIP